MEGDSGHSRRLVHPKTSAGTPEFRMKLRTVTVTFQSPIFILSAQEDLQKQRDQFERCMSLQEGGKRKKGQLFGRERGHQGSTSNSLGCRSGFLGLQAGSDLCCDHGSQQSGYKLCFINTRKGVCLALSPTIAALSAEEVTEFEYTVRMICTHQGHSCSLLTIAAHT